MDRELGSYRQLRERIRQTAFAHMDPRLAERLQREEARLFAELLARNTRVREREPEHVSKFRALLEKHRGLSIVDPKWETIDPTPDVHAMFVVFDDMFFESSLRFCRVIWSTDEEMKTIAGLFTIYDELPTIFLSQPLLVLRPRSDLVETLLHEMIHAYLFVTGQGRRDGRDGHGPLFRWHMNRINEIAGCKIGIYHSFNDEVRYYKNRQCGCNEPCVHSNEIRPRPVVASACRWSDFYDYYYTAASEEPAPHTG